MGRVPVEADKACSIRQTAGAERDHSEVGSKDFEEKSLAVFEKKIFVLLP